MCIIAILMLTVILATTPWVLQGESRETQAGGGDLGRRLQSLSLTATSHSPSPHYTNMFTQCTTTDQWITWACNSVGKREHGEGERCDMPSGCWTELWNASTVSVGKSPPLFNQLEGPLFLNFAEDNNGTCMVKAKLPGNNDVTEGSCTDETEFLKHQMMIKVTKEPFSVKARWFLRSGGVLTICIKCQRANGDWVWANPFTWMPDVDQDNLWFNLNNTDFFKVYMPTHTFAINQGTNNVASKSIPLLDNYFNIDNYKQAGYIPKCEYSVNTPIAALIGTSTAIGMRDSVTITVDTSTGLQPPQKSYLNCWRWYQTAWVPTSKIQIPFWLEIQITMNCDGGWLAWTQQDYQFLIDNYPTLTVNQDATDFKQLELTIAYEEWSVPHCYQSSPFEFRFQDNDTVIDPSRTDIPQVRNDGKLLEVFYPSAANLATARFNASIYWGFNVSTPLGTQFYRSPSWHITYCHDQLVPFWKPLPDPLELQLDYSNPNQQSVALNFSDITQQNIGTSDRQCRLKTIFFYEADGTTLINPKMSVRVPGWSPYPIVWDAATVPYRNTAQTITIKIKAVFHGGAWAWLTQGDLTKEDITITFFCGNGSARIGPRQANIYQRKEAGLPTTSFSIEQQTISTNLVNCPVVNVWVSQNSLDGGMLNQMDTQRQISPKNISLERLYKFQMLVYDQGGNYYPIKDLTLEVGCSLVGWTWDFIAETVYSPVNYTGQGIWKLVPNFINPSNISVTQYPFCFAQEHHIDTGTVNVNDTAVTQITTIANMRPECLASQPCLEIEFDSLNLPNTVSQEALKVQFSIRTRISIGTWRDSPLFTYYVCHNDSSTPLKYSFATGYGSLQAVPDGLSSSTDLTFFMTYVTGSTNPHCEVNAIFLSLDGVNFNHSIAGLLKQPEPSPTIQGAFQIAPELRNEYKKYTFFLKMITRGGKSVIDTAPYTLVVGCLKGYTDVLQDPQFIEAAQFQPKEFELYHIYLPILGKFWWCSPSDVKPVEIQTVDLATNRLVESNQTVSLKDDCTQPCQYLSLSEQANHPNRTTTFRIQMMLGRKMVYMTPTVNLTILSCVRGTAQLFYPTSDNRTEFFFMNTAQNILTLPNFGCTYKPCCTGLVTGLTREDVTAIDIDQVGFTNFTNVEVDKVDTVNNRIRLKIPVQVRSQMAFRMHQRTQFGDWAYSPWINIEVAYRVHSDPYYEEQLRLRIDGPTSVFQPNFTNGTLSAFTSSLIDGSNYTSNLSDGHNVTQGKEVDSVLNFTLEEEESEDVLKDMSKLKSFSFDFIYMWNVRNQLAAQRREYVPSYLNKTSFLEKTEFRAKIKAIHNDGTVNIVFSHPLKDETHGLDLDKIDETVLSVQTLPSLDALDKFRSTEKNAVDVLKVKQWKCKRFLRDKLDLVIEFQYPLAISVEDEKDWLLIQFLNITHFTDTNDTMRLAKSSTRLVFPLPLQMNNYPLDETFKDIKASLSTAANVVAISQIMINFLISMSLGIFIGMIETLNIIAFSSMFHQQPPPNKQLYSKALVEFLGAEVLDPSWSTELIFDFDAEEDFIEDLTTDGKLHETALTRNIYDLGFEQFDPILNVGGLYIIFALTVICIGISALIKVWWNFFKSLKQSFQLEGGNTSQNKQVTSAEGINVAPDLPINDGADLDEDVEKGTNCQKQEPVESRRKKKKNRKVKFEQTLQTESEVTERESAQTVGHHQEEASPVEEENSQRAKFIRAKEKLRIAMMKSKRHIVGQAKSIYKDLFFSLPVILIGEQVFQVAVTAFLYTKSPDQLMKTIKEKSFATYLAGTVFVVMVSFICFLVLPLVYLAIPLVKPEILEHSKFQRYFGEVYAEINTSSKQAKYYLILNYLRRLIMVMFALIIPLSVGNQLITLFFLNLFSMIFFGQQAPFQDKFKNRVALFNEACVCFLALTMVLETDFCDNLETRYYVGYMFLGVLILNISVNMALMFERQIKYIYLMLIVISKRLKWACIIIVLTIFPVQLIEMVIDLCKRTKLYVQEYKLFFKDFFRDLKAKRQEPERPTLTEAQEEEIQRLKEAYLKTLGDHKKKKEMQKLIRETQALIQQKLNINILDLYNSKQPSPAQQKFLKDFKNLQDELSTIKEEAFKCKRLQPLQIFKSQIIQNIASKMRSQVNLKILRDWTSDLSESVRVRLVFEYMTVLDFYKQWYDQNWSITPPKNKQVSSFNKFFEYYRKEILTKFQKVSIKPSELQELHQWSNVRKYILDQTPLEDASKQWYFIGFNPWWLKAPDNLGEQRDEFIKHHLAVKEEEVPGLYKILDELNEQLDFRFMAYRNKGKKKTTVARHWTVKEVAASSSPEEMTRMLRSKFTEAELQGQEAIDQLKARVPQLFQLHKMKAEKIVEQYETKKNHFGSDSHNLEEHIWQLVSNLETSDFTSQ